MNPKKIKKYNLYKIKYDNKRNSLFDIFFYIKMIAIVLFAVMDTIMDKFISIFDYIVKIIGGDWFEDVINKYNLYIKKVGSLAKFYGFSHKSSHKQIKEIRNEIFNEKEKELIFSNENKKIA